MKATMVEVAALAGVSTATVSHVVNWTRVVEPATRARVEQAIAAVGYRPNQVARSLKTSSTRTLGLAMSMLRNPYFAELAQAIEGHAARAGFSLVIADTRESAEHETLVLDQLLARQVDGIILATSSTSLPLLDLRVPIVLVDRTLDVDCDQVGPENFHSTAQLTGHLADHGRRRIAMMAGMAGISTTDERVAGYRHALASRGLKSNSALLVSGLSRSEPATEAVRALFATAEPPDAIVTGNNAMTIGVLRGLKELGRSVPGDVALACFDDFEWADLFTPSLTAVRQQAQAMGARSIELLLNRINHPDAPLVKELTSPTLQIRRSCGCPG